MEGQCARWLEFLQSYDFDIFHRPGKDHGNADSLSRKPRKHPGQETCPSCQVTRETVGIFAVLGSSLSQAEVQQAQLTEPRLSKVREFLAQPSTDPQPSPVMSFEERCLWAQRQLFQIESQLIVFQDPEGPSSKKILLPPALFPKVFKELHDGIAGGHLGVKKTQQKIKARFWWPGMSRKIEEYCRSCINCARAKPGRGNRGPLQPISSETPFQRIMCDVIGPLPKSKNGSRVVLTIQDSFTKWPVAIPLSNQRATTVARAIFEHWITQFGCPEFLVTDKGTNFESAVVKHLCRILQVKKCRTSSFHPMADGQAESFNKTLKNMIKCKIDESEGVADWEELIHPSLLAYRSSVHRGTGYTPYYMLYAREMRLPIDIGQLPEAMPQDAPEFVRAVGEKLADAHEQVRHNLQQYQRVQKNIYDSRVRGQAIEVGDKVLEYSPALQPGEAPKFHRYWRGPAVVTQKLSDVNYKIRHENGRRVRVVHYNNLRKVPERPAQFREQQRPQVIRRRPTHPAVPRGQAVVVPAREIPEPEEEDEEQQFFIVPRWVRPAGPPPEVAVPPPPEVAEQPQLQVVPAIQSPRRLRGARGIPPVRFGNPVYF